MSQFYTSTTPPRTQPTHKLKAALYSRISPREKGREGTSIENQLYQLHRAADYYIWEVYQEYSDELASGTKAEGREGLKRLMLDAKAHRFNIVAVTKLDRFFRNTRLLFNYIEELDQAGITFISTGEGFDTSTPQGRFSMKIMGVLAEWERDRIVERTTEGRYARYREGKWGPGQPLYGYKYNSETKSLEREEAESLVVERIYRLYVYDRMGFQQIARLLNDDNVPPRQQAVRWHQAAIRDIIKHPAYKGEHPSGVHLEPIVSSELWAQVQQRRKDNPHLHRRDGSPWLLQGLIRCGLCSQSLGCSYSHGKNGKRVYSCRGRLRGTRPGDNHRCTLPTIDAAWLESQSTERIGAIFTDPSKLETLLTESIEQLKRRDAELNAGLKPIDAQLAAIAEKKARLAEEWVEKALSEDRVERRRAELDREEERMRGIRQEIDPEQVLELEQTKTMVGLWEAQLKCIQRAAHADWEEALKDSTDELRPLMAITMITAMAERSGVCGEMSRKMAWPLTWRQALERLQAKLIAFPDRVEIKAVFAIPPIEYQGYSPGYRSSRCRLSL